MNASRDRLLVHTQPGTADAGRHNLGQAVGRNEGIDPVIEPKAGSRSGLPSFVERLRGALVPILFIAALALFDYLYYRDLAFVIPVGLAASGIVLVWPAFSRRIERISPKWRRTRAAIEPIAVGAVILGYYLFRGRGPLSLKEGLIVAAPTVMLTLILLLLGDIIDRSIRPFYRLRDLLLGPLRPVFGIALAVWVALAVRTRPINLPLIDSHLAPTALAGLAATAMGYFLLQRPLLVRPVERHVPLRVASAVAGILSVALVAAGVLYALRDKEAPGDRVPDYIGEQVARLGGDPAKIEAFVRDDIEPDEYRGALRGPVGTLWAMDGSEEDRALLLEAMLDRVEKHQAAVISDDNYHTLDVVLATKTGGSEVEEAATFRTADLPGRDLRVTYRKRGDGVFAVVSGPGREIVSTVDASRAQSQELMFRILGPRSEVVERRRELFTNEIAGWPSRFDPTNRYTIVVTTGWVPASVRSKEAHRPATTQEDRLARQVAYNFLSFSDENTRAMVEQRGVRATFVSPRITIVSDERIVGSSQRRLSIDARKNDIAVFAHRPQSLAFNAIRSLYDASIESEAIRAVIGQSATSAAEVLANAFGSLRRTPEERLTILIQSLERLRSKEPEGASLTLTPRVDPTLFLRFEKRKGILAVVPSEPLQKRLEALPRRAREEIEPLFSRPPAEVEALAIRADAALLALASISPTYAMDLTYAAPKPKNWYEGARILYFGARQGPRLTAPRVEIGQPQTIVSWAGLTHDNPAHPRIAADGTVFFTNDTNVTRLDPRTGTVTTWPIGIDLNGLAIDDTGAVWAVATFGGELIRLDPRTSEKTTVLEPIAYLNHLASTGTHVYAGHGYGVGHGNGVSVVDAASYSSLVTWEFDACCQPEATVADLQVVGGRIFFTEQRTDSVGILDPVARTVTRWSVPTKDSGLNGIYVDEASGHIFFTERDANKVGRLDPSSGVITEWVLPKEKVEPLHLKRGRDGRIYVTGRGSNSLFAIDPSQRGSIRLVSPTVIRVDPKKTTIEARDRETVKASTFQATRTEVVASLERVGDFLELGLPEASPHDLTPDGGYVALQGGAIVYVGALDTGATPPERLGRELSLEIEVTGVKPDLEFEVRDYWDDNAKRFLEPPLTSRVRISPRDRDRAEVVRTWYRPEGDTSQGDTFGFLSRALYSDLKEKGTAILKVRGRDGAEGDPIQVWVLERRTAHIPVNNVTREVPVLVVGGDYVRFNPQRPKGVGELPERRDDSGQIVNLFVVHDDPDFPFLLSGGERVQTAIPVQITDASTGEAVAGAKVTVTAGRASLSGETWSDGRVAIGPLPKPLGEVVVTVEAEGYEPTRLTSDFRREDILPLEISRHPLPSGARASVIDRTDTERKLRELRLSSRSRQLISDTIASDRDVVVLVPIDEVKSIYGNVEAWLEVNTRTGEAYPRMPDGLYGGETLPPPEEPGGPVVALSRTYMQTFCRIQLKVEELGALIGSGEAGGSQRAAMSAVARILRGYQGVIFGSETYQQALKETSSWATDLERRASGSPISVRIHVSAQGPWGPWTAVVLITFPPPVFPPPKRKDEEEEGRICEISYRWEPSPGIVAGLAYPRGTVKLPWGKGLPMRAVAYDVDVLKVTCRALDRSKLEGEREMCASTAELRLPARLRYDWEVNNVQFQHHGLPWTQWPDGLPRGEFKERRCTGIGQKDTGEQVLYYPPFLEGTWTAARVTTTVTITDDVDQAPKPSDRTASFTVGLEFRRIERHELQVRVSAPEAPSPPTLGPNIPKTDCPCNISFRWDNPSPISVTPPASLRVVTKERLKLRASASDRDRLVIWCEGRDWKTDVEEIPLTDVLQFTWSADGGGEFPAGNLGSTVIYEAPSQPGEVTITLMVSDSGAQFVDDPVRQTIRFRVVEQPVLVVPGIMGSRLRYRGMTVWPPDEPTRLQLFLENLESLQNLEDPDVTVSGLIDSLYASSVQYLHNHRYKVHSFPYDWRQDNAIHVSRYRAVLNAALDATEAEKIDIVCHSMGGLITREWFRVDSEAPRRVGKLLFAGTPHFGSPESYGVLKHFSLERFLKDRQLDIPFWLGVKLALPYLTGEMERRIERLVRSCPSVYQLLPSPKWFTLAEYVVNEQADSPHHPSREGILGGWDSTYVENPDARLGNQQLVDRARAFWDHLPDEIPGPAQAYAVAGISLDTPFHYALKDKRGGDPEAPAVFLGYELDLEEGSGDEVVPALSATWRTSPQFRKWEAEMARGRPGIYLIQQAKHRELLQSPDVQDFIIYVLESLR